MVLSTVAGGGYGGMVLCATAKAEQSLGRTGAVGSVSEPVVEPFCPLISHGAAANGALAASQARHERRACRFRGPPETPLGGLQGHVRIDVD